MHRRRQLLSAALKGFTQHGEVMTAYRESIAARDAALHAWRARARAKALHTSLVTARGKLRRQVTHLVFSLKQAKPMSRHLRGAWFLNQEYPTAVGLHTQAASTAVYSVRDTHLRVL